MTGLSVASPSRLLMVSMRASHAFLTRYLRGFAAIRDMHEKKCLDTQFRDLLFDAVPNFGYTSGGWVPMSSELIRRDHPGFVKEMKRLVESSNPEERSLAGYLKAELAELLALKKDGKRHPDEKRLEGGELGRISCIKKKQKRFSIRIYFVIEKGALWTLALIDKRRNNLERGEKEMLIERLHYAQKG